MKFFLLAGMCLAISPIVFGNEQLPSNAEGLTLGVAIDNTLKHHPEIAGFGFRMKALEGEKATASLKPQYRVNSSLENVAGTGNMAGMQSAEMTLSLSSVIEKSDLRSARVQSVSAEQNRLLAEQQVRTLEILSRLNRIFIQAVASQERLRLQTVTVQMAEDTVNSLKRLVDAGKTAEAEYLRARAALAKNTVDMAHIRQKLAGQYSKLAAFWAEPVAVFSKVQGDLFMLPAVPDINLLLEGMQRNPDLEVMANDIKVQEALIAQTKKESRTGIEWDAGIRQLQESDDAAFLVGLSMPLGNAQRAKGALATITSRRDEALYQRQILIKVQENHLRRLHADYRQVLAEIQALQSDVIPLLKEALQSTTRAFEQGRYGYLELNSAQAELLESEQAIINAAVKAQFLRIDIERIANISLIQNQ